MPAVPHPLLSHLRGALSELRRAIAIHQAKPLGVPDSKSTAGSPDPFLGLVQLAETKIEAATQDVQKRLTSYERELRAKAERLVAKAKAAELEAQAAVAALAKFDQPGQLTPNA